MFKFVIFPLLHGNKVGQHSPTLRDVLHYPCRFWIWCPLAKVQQNQSVGAFESAKSWRTIYSQQGPLHLTGPKVKKSLCF